MKTRFAVARTLASIGLIVVGLTLPNIGSAQFTTFAKPTMPIGIDYQPVGNQLLVSVNWYDGTNGIPGPNFNYVSIPGAVISPFTSITDMIDEIYFNIAKTTHNGWTQGEILFAIPAGTNGSTFTAIGRMNADGTGLQFPWVTLTGETRRLRGGLVIDETGLFGGDLLVAASNNAEASGAVYRVNADGVTITKVVESDTHVEGMVVCPTDARYGPLSGKLVCGAELLNGLVAIDPSGGSQFVQLDVKPEVLKIVPPCADLYGTDFHDDLTFNGDQRIAKLDASHFAGMEGDIVVAEEGYDAGELQNGNLWRLTWNGSAFVKQFIGAVGQWEYFCFGPNNCPTYCLGDRVWLDSDCNGQQDQGEPGLVGVTVNLYDSNGVFIKSTVTVADGIYLFCDLAPGTYKVCVDASTLPIGLVPTFDLDGTVTPNCATGVVAATRLDFDFGYCRPPQRGATRTWGFYKTHLALFTQVVNAGCINLGVLSCTPGSEDLTHPTLAQLESIFWSAPGNDTTALGQARLQLAHQLIAAQANCCFIGTCPLDPTLIAGAVAALDGTNTALMLQFNDALNVFNNSGDAIPLPSPLTEGSADSKGSKALAGDPGCGFH